MPLRLLLITLLLLNFFVSAQEKLGVVNSNYSPSNSIFLNPSSSADSRAFMQLKFAGVNAYIMTNFGYLPQTSFWSYRAAGELPLPKISETDRNKFVFLNLAAEGPCFVISKDNFGAGIYARARSVFNVRRMPHQLSSLILSQEPIGPNFGELDVNRAGFNNMSWLEAGVNFSYLIVKNSENMVQVGANVNYLIGYNVLYGNLKSLKGYYSDSVINIDEIDGRLVRSSPIFNSGKGFSVDLGFTYKKMLDAVDNYFPHSKRSSCRFIDYKYKLGLSLRDAGFVRFRNGVRTTEFSGSGYLSIVQEKGDFTRIPAASVNMTENSDPVRALTPLSLSGQFDYNFENHIYLTTVVVKNLVPLGVLGVQSPNLLSVIPRLEFKNIEVAMPFTLQRFLYPQIGLGLRVRSLVVGVDNVFPLIVKTNLRAMGIYVNLGFTIFRHPGCRVKPRAVDDCMPGAKIKGAKKPGLFKRIFTSGKTYRR